MIFIYSETLALMDNLAEQVIKEVEDHLTENEKPQLPQSAKNALKAQVLEIKNPEHRIRSLICEYLCFIETCNWIHCYYGM